MKPWQTDQLRRALERRRETLIEELRRDAQRVREERYGELAGTVHDAGDESTASLLADVDQAELSRDLAELREVDAALKRLADASYGVCVDCGAPIAFERLLYTPYAARCAGCQARHEKTYRK